MTTKSSSTDLHIRGVSPALVHEIDALARNQGLSRTAYVRSVLEAAVYSPLLKDIEDKYESLLNRTLQYITLNTQELHRLSYLLEERDNL